MIGVLHDMLLVGGAALWAFLIIISLHPTWGASVGMWLRGDFREPYEPPPPVETEGDDKPLEHSTRLDRWV